MAVNVGQGTILKMTISASLTAIAQVTEIEGPEVTVPAIDKTNLSDVYKRWRPGLPEPGKVSFKIQFDPADTTHQALSTAANTFPQPIVAWTITYNTQSGTAHDSFTGFVSSYKKTGMNQEDNLTGELEIQMDSLPVPTP